MAVTNDIFYITYNIYSYKDLPKKNYLILSQNLFVRSKIFKNYTICFYT